MKMKKILIFGAGFVSKPMVGYLLKNGFEVHVASRTVSKAENLIKGQKNGVAIQFDISKEEGRLDELIPKADLVVSLLPYAHHVKVAKACIKHKINMVTTSYVSAEMKALDQEAKNADIVIINEIGVDPGIDHMSAMRIIDNVKGKGGKISQFKSYCGGLPAPEANTNPYGYKFSWSPRGVVLAGTNPGVYLDKGQKVDIKKGTLFKEENVSSLHVEHDNLGDFEVYANRDSLQYIDLYGIPEVENMFRGTLRNQGWCQTIDKFFDLGLLEEENQTDLSGKTFKQVMALLANSDDKDVKQAVANKMDIPVGHEIIKRMDWLELFSDNPIPELGKEFSPLDILAKKLELSLQYDEGERDMIVLVHDFLAEYPDGKKERISSTLIDYGVPNGDSSMSRTVSLPAAIACKMILEGKITRKGVIIPTTPDLYNPVLDELETLDIVCKEEVTTL
jgi:saccharopine dehydrogenase (NADP+, L-glutamate forming)/spermidine synthase